MQDLNADPTLPFANADFDGVLCCVSIDYLTRPVEVLAEVARVMAGAPPVVVTLDHPLADWNAQSVAVMRAALARDYRLVQIAPREDGHMLVYIRRTPDAR